MCIASLRTVLFIAVIWVCAVGCGNREGNDDAQATSSSASPASSPVAAANAATEYQRIYTRMGKMFLEPLSHWQDGISPTAEEEKYLQSQQENIRAIIAAAAIEPCDFGVKYNQGIETEASHSRWIMHFTRLLSYDARRFLKQPGGERGAAERLAAILQMARHAGEEPVIISRLVGYACVETAASVIDDHRNRFADANVKSILHRPAQAIRAGALFSICPVIPQELQILKTTIEQSRGSLNFGVGEIAIAESEKPVLISEIERMFAAAQQHCAAPDAQQQLTRVDDLVRNEKVKQLTPKWGQFVKQMERARGRLDAVIVATK